MFWNSNNPLPVVSSSGSGSGRGGGGAGGGGDYTINCRGVPCHAISCRVCHEGGWGLNGIPGSNPEDRIEET